MTVAASALPAPLSTSDSASLGRARALFWFTLAVFLLANAHPFGFIVALLAGPLMALGALAGRQAYRFLEKPGGGSVTAFLLVFGLGMPLLTGVFDLYLRLHTP